MEELIICVAPCPGEDQVEQFSIGIEVVEEVTGSHDAGASKVHLHVLDEEESV